MARRFQSHAVKEEPKVEAFNNKFNFNINPPPVHTYWHARNFTVLLAFAPIYVAVGFLAKYTGENLNSFEALLDFADSEKSPMKEYKFGEFRPTK